MKIDVYKTDAALGKCAPPPAAGAADGRLTISFDPTRLDRDRVHALADWRGLLVDRPAMGGVRPRCR